MQKVCDKLFRWQSGYEDNQDVEVIVETEATVDTSHYADVELGNRFCFHHHFLAIRDAFIISYAWMIAAKRRAQWIYFHFFFSFY